MAILSSSAGFLPADKRELILPRAVMTAVFAENPVGQRRQSCRSRTNENRSIRSRRKNDVRNCNTLSDRDVPLFSAVLPVTPPPICGKLCSHRSTRSLSAPCRTPELPTKHKAVIEETRQCRAKERMGGRRGGTKSAHLDCSLTDCRMRAEAHVVVPGEKDQFPVHLVFLAAHHAI